MRAHGTRRRRHRPQPTAHPSRCARRLHQPTYSTNSGIPPFPPPAKPKSRPKRAKTWTHDTHTHRPNKTAAAPLLLSCGQRRSRCSGRSLARGRRRRTRRGGGGTGTGTRTGGGGARTVGGGRRRPRQVRLRHHRHAARWRRRLALLRGVTGVRHRWYRRYDGHRDRPPDLVADELQHLTTKTTAADG